MQFNKQILLITILYLLSHNVDALQKVLPKINIAILPHNESLSGLKDYIIRAYSLIGYRVALHQYPPGDSIKMTNVGKLDAELIRTPVIELSAKNLKRVPVKLLSGQLVLYCLNHIKCDSDVLNDVAATIGIISGKNITSNYMEDKNAPVYQIKGSQNLVKLFEKQRIQYILSLDIDGIGNIGSIDKSQYQSFQLALYDSYHYVHKKHEELIPELTLALQQAIEEIGPWEEYLK
jgi:hypothetical protein